MPREIWACAQLVEPGGAGLEHERGVVRERVGRHRRVVRRLPLGVGLGDRQPLLQVDREAGRGRRHDLVPAGLAEHHVARARRAAPPLLRGAEQDVDAERRSCPPTAPPTRCSRGRRAHRPRASPRRRRGRSRRAAACRPPSPRAPRRRPRDGCARWPRPPRRPGPGPRAPAARRTPGGRGRRSSQLGHRAGVEDLRPAVGEQAVADDEAAPAGRQLPGDGLHGVGAATRDDRDRLGGVGRAQDVDDVLHHPDEALATCG